jgi:hypothetical protein
MLRANGVLAICVDQRVLYRLGRCWMSYLDELFGGANRLAIINWQNSYAPRGDNGMVSTAVLVYANSETVKEAQASRSQGGYVPRQRPLAVPSEKTTSFSQVPDVILASFGLDVRSEPFSNEDLD